MGRAGANGSVSPSDAALHVCHIIHSLGAGGAEQSLVALAEAAPDAGLRMSVLSLTTPGTDRHADRLRQLGVDVISLRLPSRWDPRALSRAMRLVRALRPNVVHTHLKHADLVGAYVARRLRVPLVSTLHLIEDGPTPLGRLKLLLAAYARGRTAAVTIAVSDALRQWYVRRFRARAGRVVTIHNGVVTRVPAAEQERARLRATLGVGPQQVLAVMVGVMRPGKGHLDLMRAAADLPPDSRVHLLLVGDGELEPQIRQAASAASVPVTLAGYRTDVAALLDASDLVVHPSHFDALPTALIEALAAGRPIVATSVGGVPEIVGPEVGRLVPPGDVAALRAALVELAADTDGRERLGRAARARYEREFEAGLWARRLRECYEGALAAG